MVGEGVGKADWGKGGVLGQRGIATRVERPFGEGRNMDAVADGATVAPAGDGQGMGGEGHNVEQVLEKGGAFHIKFDEADAKSMPSLVLQSENDLHSGFKFVLRAQGHHSDMVLMRRILEADKESQVGKLSCACVCRAIYRGTRMDWPYNLIVIGGHHA